MQSSTNPNRPAPTARSRRAPKFFAVLLVVGLSGGLFAAVLAAQPKPAPPTTPPPAPVITGAPASPTNLRTATFSFTDARNGVSFLCRRDGFAFAACNSPKTFAGELASGPHTFAVKAVDAGGQSAVTSATWTIDHTDPPPPVVTSGPSRPTYETTATFSFTDAEADVRFRCKLGGGAYKPCSSGVTYTGLSVKGHTFAVRAVDAAGNWSHPTHYKWTVLAPVDGFTIGGSLSDLLHPGGSSVLDVSITNPNNFAISVTGLTVAPKAATTRDGLPNPACDGTVNLVASRQHTGPSLVIPKNATRTLSQLGVPQSQWPELTMPNLSTNQDACKATTFTFGYSATATKVQP